MKRRSTLFNALSTVIVLYSIMVQSQVAQAADREAPVGTGCICHLRGV